MLNPLIEGEIWYISVEARPIDANDSIHIDLAGNEDSYVLYQYSEWFLITKYPWSD